MGAPDILEGAEAQAEVETSVTDETIVGPITIDDEQVDLDARAEWEHTLAQMELEGHESIASIESAQLDVLVDSALERLTKCREELAHIADVAARRTLMISNWAGDESHAIAKTALYWDGRVRALFPGMDLRGKKSKKLPHGTVGTSQKGGGIEIVDQEKADAWAKKNNVEMKATPDIVQKKPIAAYLKGTGDVPDVDKCGWRVVPVHDEFYVK